VKDISGEALGMDANQRRRLAAEAAHRQCDSFLDAGARLALESVNPEMPELGWKVRFGHLGEPQRGGMIHA
jgi:hypothetical protein